MEKPMAKKNALPFDYSDHQDPAANQDDVLGRISVLADKMHELDREVAEAALRTKQLQAQRDQIAEEQLPELFAQVGLAELVTNGRHRLPLKLKNKLFTNISKGRKPKAIAWLDANGQGGMVKRAVIIEFDKTQQEKVDKLLKLIGRGWPNNRTELDVHASTVKAFVKKELEEGREIPKDVFGIHCVDVVEITSKKN
jgi:hypothetical protein